MRQIVDANGNVTLAESYEPYGSVLTSTGTASSIFGYSGEEVDTYIKLLFLRARYYSPETARFLSKDVWQGDYTRPQSLNGWMYVEGDPINQVDPSGQWSCRPSPNTPSCENWVQSALDRLREAGPQGENMWLNFTHLDEEQLISSIGVTFYIGNEGDVNGESRNSGWERWSFKTISLRSSYLQDTIGSYLWEEHVGVFAHEIQHIVNYLGGIQSEVDAYVREGIVMRELGHEPQWIAYQLAGVAWEEPGYVTEDLGKLCRAREILIAWDDSYQYFPLTSIFSQYWCDRCWKK